MKLFYTKKAFYINLAIGSLLLIFVMVKLFFPDPFNWFDGLMIVLAFYYLSKFYYLKTHPYLELTDTHFKRHSILNSKKIPVKSLENVYQNPAGDLILVSEQNRIEISSAMTNREDLENFKNYLSSLDFRNDFIR